MKLASLLKSKLFIGVTAAVVSAAAVVTGLVLKNRTEDYRVIKVFEVNGQALVSRPDVGEIDPYSGMNLENGDTVSTYKDSTMRMVLDDTKYVFMEQESRLELEASGNASDSRTHLVLKSGAILNEITESLSAGSTYEVTAPKATMAVHGTSFRVSVSKDEFGDYITKLEVFHGEVKVCLLDEDGNPTDKTALVGPDKCIIIKTIRNEHSGNDPSIDGTSFFVYPDENGELIVVPEGEDPTQPIDYFKIPYDTLKELYNTDHDDEIELYEEILEKIIEAMSDGGDDKATDAEGKTEKETSATTTTTAQTPEPEKTSTTTEVTTTVPDKKSTTTKTTTSGTTKTTTKAVTSAARTTVTTGATTTTKSTTTTKTTTTTSITTTKISTSKQTTSTEEQPPVIAEYTVEFYDYDGTLLSTQMVLEGNSATAPTNYKGSYTDEDGWTWTFSKWDKPFTNITADTTVTAIYVQKPQYTVIFKDYDGTQLSKQTIEEGKAAVEPENYKGSYKDEDGWTWTFSKWDKPFTNITADTTVTAVYVQKPQYTVIFKDYDGTQLSKQTVEEGKDAVEPENYKGSYTDDDGWTWTFSKWDKSFTNITADTTVTAIYVQKPQYTVIFKDYDGTELSKQTVEEGKAAVEPENYKGSYTDEDGWTWTFSKWDKSFTNITADTTVTAVYVQKSQYTVIFKDYDGTQLSKQTVEEGNDAVEPENYKGSYTDEDGWTWMFSKWDKSFTNITADTTVTAVYVQKPQYTVIFKDYDGTQLSKQTVEEGKDATAPTNYKGSYTDEDGWTWTFSKWDKPFTNITADTTVTAIYVQKPQYTVIFKDYDGTQLSKQTVEEGKDAVEPENYKGAYTDEDGWTWTFSKWDKSFTNITADTTVTAVYVQKPQYTVIFKDYDGTQLSKQTVEEGKDAVEPENYKGSYKDEDGWTWTFSKWDKSFTNITADTTVTAIYVQKPQYTVIFKDYDGTQLSKQTVEEGKDAVEPENYKGTYTDEDGWTWTFSKWDKSFTNIKADTTVTAVYVQKPHYTVIFKDYDGTQLSKQTVEEGKDAVEPENYKGAYTDEDGWTWTFSKWDKSFTNIMADTIVTAVYVQKPQYTVVFKDYDGTQLSKQTVEEGKSAVEPENYKGIYKDEDGWTWTFSGWDKQFTKIVEDTTVTAVYVQKPQYTVIFEDYDGTQLSKQTVEDGKSAVEPENYKGAYTDEDGWTWTFSKWDKSFTNIKADTTVTAVYVQKPQYTVIFKDYDGTQLSKQTVEEGKDAVEPENYKGAYTDEDGWTWTFSKWDKPFTNITADTTVTAIYVQKPHYTVIFEDYDGTQLSKQTVEEGKDAVEPENYKGTYIDEDGWTWTFSKWDKPFTNIMADTTVTAVYVQKPQYTVIFKDYDGTQLSKQTVEEGKSATAPTNYKGTYTDEDGWTWTFSKWDKSFTKIVEDTTVTAVYVQKPQYTVIFKDYDGTQLSKQTVEEGKDAFEPENYKGSYTDEDGWTWTFSKWDKSFTNITADTTVTAVYVQKPQYTVIFKDYDGTQLSKQTVEEGKDAVEPENYKGSYTDDDGWTWTFSKWDKPFTNITADTTVTAVYVQKPQYTVIFKDYDGTQLSKQTVEEGNSATAPENYKGSYTDEDGWTWTFSKWDKSFTKIVEDTTVTAIYVQKPQYTVIFKDYDGTQLSKQTIEEGKDAVEPENYKGIYKDEDGWTWTFSKWDKSFTKIVEDTTVTAIYVQKPQYTVIFKDYDGTQLSKQTVEEGKDAVEPENYKGTYTDEDGWTWTFSKWDKSFTKITADTIVTAVYVQKAQYTVIFKDYDGTQLSKQTVEEGKSAVEPENYKGSYTDEDGWTWTFTGWDKPFAKIEEDTTVTAEYTQKPNYPVIFKGFNGVTLSEQTVEEGNSADEPEIDEELIIGDVHYFFDGWDKDFSEIHGELTVSAKFITGYEVIFQDSEEQQIGYMQIVLYGEDAEPPVEGFDRVIEIDGDYLEFMGWDGEYTNITYSRTLTAVYGKGGHIYLHDMMDVEERDLSPDYAQELDSEYELDFDISKYETYGYNVGWFHATSGIVVDSTEPVSTAQVLEYDDYNHYVLTRYAMVNFTNGEENADVMLVCMGNGSYYLYVEGFDYPVFLNYSSIYKEEDDNCPEVLGKTLLDYTFKTKDGAEVRFGDLGDYLSEQDEPVLFTDALFTPKQDSEDEPIVNTG